MGDDMLEFELMMSAAKEEVTAFVVAELKKIYG